MSEANSTTGYQVRRKPTTTPAGVAITSSSVANPTVITTSAPHGLRSFTTGGDTTTIAGHTGATPSLNGVHPVTVLTPTTFTIPVAVTVAGTGGTSTTDFQVVAELTSVGPGGKSRNKIESSTHNDGTESHVLGIIRQKDPTLAVNLVDDPSHVAINDDFNNNVKSTWQFASPTGFTRTGDARVQAFDYDDAPVDAKEAAKLTLTWSGVVTEVFPS